MEGELEEVAAGQAALKKPEGEPECHLHQDTGEKVKYSTAEQENKQRKGKGEE